MQSNEIMKYERNLKRKIGKEKLDYEKKQNAKVRKLKTARMRSTEYG